MKTKDKQFPQHSVLQAVNNEFTIIEKLARHIMCNIESVSNPPGQPGKITISFESTESKITLLELIYALWPSGIVSANDIEIIEFEKAFRRLVNFDMDSCTNWHIERKDQKVVLPEFRFLLTLALKKKMN